MLLDVKPCVHRLPPRVLEIFPACMRKDGFIFLQWDKVKATLPIVLCELFTTSSSSSSSSQWSVLRPQSSSCPPPLNCSHRACQCHRSPLTPLNLSIQSFDASCCSFLHLKIQICKSNLNPHESLIPICRH